VYQVSPEVHHADMLDWWLSLFSDHGLIGPLIGLVIAAFVVLLVANAIIWPMAGIKHLATRNRS